MAKNCDEISEKILVEKKHIRSLLISWLMFALYRLNRKKSMQNIFKAFDRLVDFMTNICFISIESKKIDAEYI
jgi:hypothetical protein